MNSLLARGKSSVARALAVLLCASLIVTCPGPAAYAAAGEILGRQRSSPQATPVREFEAVNGAKSVISEVHNSPVIPRANAAAAHAALPGVVPATAVVGPKAPAPGAVTGTSPSIGIAAAVALDSIKLSAQLGQTPRGFEAARMWPMTTLETA